MNEQLQVKGNHSKMFFKKKSEGGEEQKVEFTSLIFS